MSLDKAVFFKKEKRRSYYDSRRFDWSCRNHRGCPWCVGNRLYRRHKQKIAARQEVSDAKVYA